VGLRAVGHPDCGLLAWCCLVRRRTVTDFAATRLAGNRITDGVLRSFDSPHLIDRTLVVNAADALSESQVLGAEPQTRGTAWNRGQPVCARGQGMIRGAHKGLPVPYPRCAADVPTAAVRAKILSVNDQCPPLKAEPDVGKPLKQQVLTDSCAEPFIGPAFRQLNILIRSPRPPRQRTA
jgi:hypothetical protein